MWPWVLGGILLLLVLMFGGCALLISRGIDAVTGPVDAANAWLAAAESGDDAELENLTCNADTSVIEGGAGDLRDAGFDGSKSLNSFNIVNNEATVGGTVGTDSGDVAISFSLAEAGDGEGESGWCVESVFVG